MEVQGVKSYVVVLTYLSPAGIIYSDIRFEHVRGRGAGHTGLPVPIMS